MAEISMSQHAEGQLRFFPDSTYQRHLESPAAVDKLPLLLQANPVIENA